MAKELDEKGFVFVGKDGNAYRCCMWGSQPWLFRWRDGDKRFESLRPLTQMDVWMSPHNLTDEQQAFYFNLEAATIQSLLPDNKDKMEGE